MNTWIQDHVKRSKSNTLNGVHGIPILFKHLIFVISQIYCSKLNIPHQEYRVNYFRRCIKWVFWLICRDYQRACVVHQIGWNQPPSICTSFQRNFASMLLYIGYKAPTPLNFLNLYWLKSEQSITKHAFTSATWKINFLAREVLKKLNVVELNVSHQLKL